MTSDRVDENGDPVETVAGAGPVIVRPEIRLSAGEQQVLDSIAARTGQSVSALIQDLVDSTQANSARNEEALASPNGQTAENGHAVPTEHPAPPSGQPGEASEVHVDPDISSIPESDPDHRDEMSEADVPSTEPHGVQDAPAGVPTPPRVTRARLLLLAGAVVVVVALLIGLGYFWNRARTDDRLNTARAQAVAAGTVYAQYLGGYDYQHLTQDLARIPDNSTPSFAADYRKSTAVLAPLLTRYKASAKPSVIAIAVQTATTQRVTVLVFLDQAATNSTRKGTTTTRHRITITMVHQNGRWLIDQLHDL